MVVITHEAPFLKPPVSAAFMLKNIDLNVSANVPAANPVVHPDASVWFSSLPVERAALGTATQQAMC